MTPYYQDDMVTLYHGDCRDIAPSLSGVDSVVTDPPYAETSLTWDRWPDGWVAALPTSARSLWCFGSLKMFTARWAEFATWTHAQEIVWEKHNGTNMANDRFRRVHELALHFYRGAWGELYKAPQFTMDAERKTVKRKKTRPVHWGAITPVPFESVDGGPRMMRSVLQVRSCHGHAVHPTQKPEGIVAPLVAYSTPPSGTVLDAFAGSGTTLVVAKQLGLRSIGIEGQERYCEIAAERCRLTGDVAA